MYSPDSEASIFAERFGVYDWDTPLVKVWYEDGSVRVFRIEDQGSRVEIPSPSVAAHAFASAAPISESKALELAKARAESPS